MLKTLLLLKMQCFMEIMLVIFRPVIFYQRSQFFIILCFKYFSLFHYVERRMKKHCSNSEMLERLSKFIIFLELFNFSSRIVLPFFSDLTLEEVFSTILIFKLRLNIFLPSVPGGFEDSLLF